MANYSEEKIEQILRTAGLKATDHRISIFSIISKNKSPTTLNTLQDKLNEIVNIDQATVYRNLNSLIKAKLIRKYSYSKNTPSYELAEAESSSFFLCDLCKQSQNLKNDVTVKNFLKQISKKATKIKGFQGAYIEIHGSCKKCA